MLKFFSGLVTLLNIFLKWKERRELIQTGEALQEGKQDAKTIDNINKAVSARDRDNSALDSELCADCEDDTVSGR